MYNRYRYKRRYIGCPEHTLLDIYLEAEHGLADLQIAYLVQYSGGAVVAVHSLQSTKWRIVPN